MSTRPRPWLKTRPRLRHRATVDTRHRPTVDLELNFYLDQDQDPHPGKLWQEQDK